MTDAVSQPLAGDGHDPDKQCAGLSLGKPQLHRPDLG